VIIVNADGINLAHAHGLVWLVDSPSETRFLTFPISM